MLFLCKENGKILLFSRVLLLIFLSSCNGYNKIMRNHLSDPENYGTYQAIIVEFTTETLRRQGSGNMAVTGQMRLLNHPEYRNIDKAQQVISGLDEDALSNLPAVMQNANGTKVLVGPENVAQELKDTSVVMTKFDIGDGMQGMIGVVGPTRMDYAKVTARLSYFAESLSKMFAKPETPQLPSADAEEN